MATHGLKGRARPRKNRSLVKKKGKSGKAKCRLTRSEFRNCVRLGKDPEELRKKKASKFQPKAEATTESDNTDQKPVRGNAGSSKDDKKHRHLYSPGERILLVGEGNFSFALALCRHLGDGSNVFATALDSEATLKKKYPGVDEIRTEIEEKFCGTTLVGVDATRLHEVKQFRGAFEKVIFNFPELGDGEKDVEKSIANHMDLLAKFSQSAEQCLANSFHAQIHISLKIGEPYKSWKVASTVPTACKESELVNVVQFMASAWNGYEYRRTVGQSKAVSEELGKGAKVYIFGKSKKKKKN